MTSVSKNEHWTEYFLASAIMATFIARRRVEFCDTDMAGIMHFSNYLRYMEFAEQEFLRSQGLSVLWDEGGVHYGLPKVNTHCDYRRSARFEQILEIEVAVVTLGTKSITYSFTFRHEGQVLAECRMTSVCCRMTAGGELVAVPLPEFLRAKLAT